MLLKWVGGKYFSCLKKNELINLKKKDFKLYSNSNTKYKKNIWTKTKKIFSKLKNINNRKEESFNEKKFSPKLLRSYVKVSKLEKE